MQLVNRYNEKLRQPTMKEIDDFLTYRANHVALVQRLGKLAFDKDFANHDFDKLTAKGKDFDLMVMRNASKKSNLKLSDEDRNELRKISAKHAKSQKHHAEYWDSAITIRNFDADDKNIIHASRMPYRYIAEMACDWAACALYHNEDIFAWYNKVVDNTLILTDKQKEHLRDCLTLIALVIKKNDVHYPDREYNAKLKEAFTQFTKSWDYALYNQMDPKAFTDYLRKKIEDDWKLDIKKDTSTASTVSFNVASRSSTPNARAEALQNVIASVRKDPTAELISSDSSKSPKATIRLDPEEYENWEEFDLTIDIKPTEAEGASSKYVSSHETLWCYFLCCRLNGKEDLLPKSKEEMTSFDFSVLGINAKFELPESWWKSFTQGTDELMKYFEKGVEYVGYREGEDVIDINGGAPTISIHDAINKGIATRKDLGMGEDRNHWNPADIYIVKKSEIRNFLVGWNKVVRSGSLNDIHVFLAEQILSKTAIGISLKKVGKNVKSELINMDETGYSVRNVADKFINPVIKLSAFNLDTNKGAKSTGSVRCNSERDQDILDFRFGYLKGGSYGVETELNSASSKEGKAPNKLLEDVFKEYGVPEIRAKHLSELTPYVERIASLPLVNATFGGIGIWGNQLIIYWKNFVDASRRIRVSELTEVQKDCLRAWSYNIRFLYLMVTAKKKDGNLDKVLGKIRGLCRKEGPGFAPYILIH